MFAYDVIRLVKTLPATDEAKLIGRQLLRSGMSVAANYRAACRARSRKEFIAKMGIVEEEGDECQFWLDLLRERGIADSERISSLHREAGQIVAMTVSSIRTARQASRSTPHSAFRTPQPERRCS